MWVPSLQPPIDRGPVYAQGPGGGIDKSGLFASAKFSGQKRPECVIPTECLGLLLERIVVKSTLRCLGCFEIINLEPTD